MEILQTFVAIVNPLLFLLWMALFWSRQKVDRELKEAKQLLIQQDDWIQRATELMEKSGRTFSVTGNSREIRPIQPPKTLERDGILAYLNEKC